jgi:uncharacterized membrane protein YobD (UPF0266 family)
MTDNKGFFKKIADRMKAKRIENSVKKEYNARRFKDKIGNYAQLLSIIVKTALFTSGGVGFTVAAISSVISLLAVITILVSQNVVNTDAKYTYWLMGASIVLNIVFISWMFLRREYRYYWANVVKMYKNINRGVQFVYALILFKNKSCIFEVLLVEDGMIIYNKKPYFIRQENVYRDLKGGWTTCVIEEDNSEIKGFFKSEPYISADKLAAFMHKTKAWAEIWASKRNNKMTLILIGILIAVVVMIYLLYTYNGNLGEQVGKACLEQCSSVYKQCAATDITPK